jgi:arylsulfatase A
VCGEPVSGVDLLPTLCALAGIEAPPDRAIDGASLLPLFQGKPVQRKTPLYWQFNRAQGRPKVAMRAGDWKILAALTGPEPKPGADVLPAENNAMKTAELDRFELYHLGNDVGETTDLAQREPQRLAELRATLGRMYHEVRDATPVWSAWTWSRRESDRVQWPPYWTQRPKPRAGKKAK